MTHAPRTMILTRRDVVALMDREAWLEAAETGFRAASEGLAGWAMPMHLEASGGGFHAKGATMVLDRLYAALKLNGNFPANPDGNGLPTIQGAILLCDGGTGSLLAVIDSIEVTLRRTAAATALAARYLARADSATILICGCGEQGAAQLAALRDVLPLRRCFAWDREPERAKRLAEAAVGAGFEASAVGDLAGAAQASDVIVACTTARAPYLRRSMVSPGTFVAAVGADSPDKSELEPELMAASLVVADVLDQCAAMGDLHHALAGGAMTSAGVHAELAELLGGRKPGRSFDEEVTIFDSTGTALQDVAAAAAIHRRALDRPDLLSVAMGAQ